MTLRDEIFEQPAVLRALLETQAATIEQVAAMIRSREIAYVYLAARGTSEHAGIYGQYILGAFNRLPVALAAPSLFSVYHQPPRLERALVVGVSQSGQSPDIVSVIEEGKRQGALTLAVTNDVTSPLAAAANVTLDICAGNEQAVAATKTYTAQLMVLAMLSVALEGSTERAAALRRIPDAMQQALTLEPEVQQAAARYGDLRQCVVIGRGYNFATAMEWSLKLKELAYIMAERYSTAEFQHGPIALVERGFPLLAVLSHDATSSDTVALLNRLAQERGANVLVVCDYDAPLDASHTVLRLATAATDWLAPLTTIVPAQLFCYHLALAQGYDPGTPRGLRKITRTQ